MASNSTGQFAARRFAIKCSINNSGHWVIEVVIGRAMIVSSSEMAQLAPGVFNFKRWAVKLKKRPVHIRLMENYKRSWRPDRQIQPLNARQHFVSLSLQSDYREPSKVRLINRISHIHRILQPLKNSVSLSVLFFFFFGVDKWRLYFTNRWQRLIE